MKGIIGDAVNSVKYGVGAARNQWHRSRAASYGRARQKREAQFNKQNAQFIAKRDKHIGASHQTSDFSLAAQRGLK